MSGQYSDDSNFTSDILSMSSPPSEHQSPSVVSSKENLNRPKTWGKRPRNIYSCSSDGNLIANTLSSAADNGLTKESLKRPQMGAKRPKKI